MQIDKIRWDPEIVEKLAVKHGIETWEVDEIFQNGPRFRFRHKGHRAGEDMYSASGQSDGGRYLIVYFIYKPPNENRPFKQGLIISARDMTSQERKQYGRK